MLIININNWLQKQSTSGKIINGNIDIKYIYFRDLFVARIAENNRAIPIAKGTMIILDIVLGVSITLEPFK